MPAMALNDTIYQYKPPIIASALQRLIYYDIFEMAMLRHDYCKRPAKSYALRVWRLAAHIDDIAHHSVYYE